MGSDHPPLKAGLASRRESLTSPASASADNRRTWMSSADKNLGEVAQLQMYFDIGKDYVHECLSDVRQNGNAILEGEASYVVTAGIDFLVKRRLVVPRLT